jgi:hypothetical protein
MIGMYSDSVLYLVKVTVMGAARWSVPVPLACVARYATKDSSSGSSCVLDLLGCLGGPLQFREARFDILKFNCLGGVLQHAVRSPYFGGGWSTWVDHDLQQSRYCGTRGLLKARNRLRKGPTPSLTVRGIELRVLHPAQECIGRDLYRACGVLDAAVREERCDGLFSLTPELCAVPYHLPQSGSIWRAG